MKSFKLIRLALLGIIIAVSLASCSSENDVLPTDIEVLSPKEYIVSLGYSGEIVDISHSPLSRAAANTDIYAIQVYSCPDIEQPTDEENWEPDYQDYTQYAYGLFDNANQMSLKLLEGYKYKFVATMLVDAKTRLNGWQDEEGIYTYGYPFYTYGSNFRSTPLKNSFQYSSSDYLEENYLGNGYAYSTIMNTDVNRPEFDRYYGELTDYIPSQNGTANISMKRTSFGIKVIAKELLEGKLTVRIEGSVTLHIDHPNTEVQELLSFNSCRSAWSDGHVSPDGIIYNYSEHIPISFTWTKDDGVELPIGTQTIQFIRNKLTTISIKVSDKGTDNDIGITYGESGEMEEGVNVDIDTGGSTDNDVNPQV